MAPFGMAGIHPRQECNAPPNLRRISLVVINTDNQMGDLQSLYVCIKVTITQDGYNIKITNPDSTEALSNVFGARR